MIRTYHHAADDRDLKAITRGSGSLARNLFRASFPAALFLFAVVYVIWRSLFAAFIAGIVLFAASAISNIRFFGDVRRRQDAKADSEAVAVTEVEASRILDIEHLGSHGPALVFFVDERKALLLVGQWLLDQRSFPAKSFQLRQWSDTKKPIRIEASGGRIKPENSAIRLRPSYRLTDIELFEATPETLQDDLDKAFDKTAV
ncbi:MAG: hypothetical protein QOD03_702 [Verrucomicrobiota bacterium]|jgi:hypothetical protein